MDQPPPLPNELNRKSNLKYARPIVAFLMALSIGWASGPFIRSGGFGSLFLLLICACACPTIVCSITDRWYYFLAPLTTVVMCVSLQYYTFLSDQKHSGRDPWIDFKLNLDITIAMAVFSLVISLGVALAFHLLRQPKRLR